jgi:hypothetical protein
MNRRAHRTISLTPCIRMMDRRSAKSLGSGTTLEMEMSNTIWPWSDIICIMTRKNPCMQLISSLMMSSIMDDDLGNSNGFILSLIMLNRLCAKVEIQVHPSWDILNTLPLLLPLLLVFLALLSVCKWSREVGSQSILTLRNPPMQ